MKITNNDKNNDLIISIIITYLPNLEILQQTYKSLLTQVDQLIIVDNTPEGSPIVLDIQNQNIEKITTIILSENVGIGKAQNIGIERAIELGAEYIVLSDQDTEYPSNYISVMMDSYHNLPYKNQVASIVPDVRDVHKNGISTGFEVFEGFRSRRVFYESGCHEITEGIASGMIVPVKVLKDVGLMSETLFIDWVDNEWFWKAKYSGYKIIACTDVAINHIPGDDPTVSMFNKKKVHNLSSPVRHYYKIRNGITLSLRCKYIPIGRKGHLFYHSLRSYAVYVLQGKPRLTHMRYASLGLLHGLFNRLGKF